MVKGVHGIKKVENHCSNQSKMTRDEICLSRW